MPNKNIMSPKVCEVPGAHGDPGRTSSPGVSSRFCSESVRNPYSGFSRMLNTNMTTPRISEGPGAPGGPLLLEFRVDFVRNRSEIVIRGFSRMLNTNITSLKACEVPVAHGDPGRTSSPGVSSTFCSGSVRNPYSGVFEDAKHIYYIAEGSRSTWGNFFLNIIF